MKKIADKIASLKARENEKGFTLIELVIVVAIIGILTAIAIPSYGAIQNTARQNSTTAAATDAYTAGLAALANGGTPTEITAALDAIDSEAGDEITVTHTGTTEDDLAVHAEWAADDTITADKP